MHMKKLFSIVLMAALLVTCITPALYSSAADVPSFVVEENTEFDENAGTVDVTFGIADNPGISTLDVLVYYLEDELSVAGFANGTAFDTPDTVQAAPQKSNSRNMQPYFPVEEFGETVYNVTRYTLYAPSLDADETENGTFLNVTFNLDGDHAAGAEFTYGIKVMSATNLAGDPVEFAGKQEGKLTSTPDPYKDIYENFTVFTTEGTVDVGAKEVTVDLRLVNNPGIGTLCVYIAYDEALNLTKVETVDGIFSGSEFTVSDEKHGDPDPANPEDENPSVTRAFEHKNISREGKAYAVFLAAASEEENRTAGGVLAHLTFALPEGMQAGDRYAIDFCWNDTDFVQFDMDNLDGSGMPELVYLEPDNPTCYVGTKVCEHPNVVLEEVKAATCTETGLKSGVCPDCGATVEEVIPMIPHTPSDTPKVTPPTCTEAGKITTVCSVCGNDIETVEDPDNPALGHDTENATETITKPATCTETGLKDIICGREGCGEVLQKDVEIPMIPHTEATKVVDPTCTEAGKIITYCSVCDTVIKEEVDPDHPEALGHTPGTPVVTKPATCTEEGSQDIFCTVCEEKIATETIPMLDHEIVTEVIDPTCVEAGKIVTKCSVCGEVFSEEVDEEHPATGHTPGEPEIIDPTATEDGSKTIKCTVCGEVLSTEKIPATGVVTTDDGAKDTTASSKDDDTTKAPSKDTGKNPVTGDNMVYVVVVAALAVVGCAAVVVIRKRKVSAK